MEKIKKYLPHQPHKIIKWFFLVLVVLFILLEAVRLPFRLQEENTAAQVAKIHATKLTLDDVMGKNLPPDPGALADKTVAGIDANNNGIRDDVELAIFREYPNSAKTRAVLLQYALALQMEVVQPIVNKDTVTQVAIEQSRADSCLADTLVPRKSPESSRSSFDMQKIDNYISFIKNKQFNTQERKQAEKSFFNGHLGSYELIDGCDLDLSALPN